MAKKKVKKPVDFGTGAAFEGAGVTFDPWQPGLDLEGLRNARRSELVLWAEKHSVDMPDGTRPKYEMFRAIEALYIQGKLSKKAMADLASFTVEAN